VLIDVLDELLIFLRGPSAFLQRYGAVFAGIAMRGATHNDGSIGGMMST
jgi:hypothetical protein